MHVHSVGGCKSVLIGATGYAGVGKDAFASKLTRDCGYVRYAFADKIKELALRLDPKLDCGHLAPYVASVGWDQAKKDKSVRNYLQQLGQGMREIIGENVWVDAVLPSIKESLRTGKHVVVTDVRHKNEANAIESLGGSIIHIRKKGVEGVNGHISEQGEAFDFAEIKVDNDHSIDDLENAAKVIHESMLESKGPGLSDQKYLDPDVMIATYTGHVHRAMAEGVETVLRIAAPCSEGAGEWVKRHSTRADIISEDEIIVEVDNQEAGSVVYADGVITIDAFIAR